MKRKSALLVPLLGAAAGLLALYLAGGGTAAFTPAAVIGVAAAALTAFAAALLLSRPAAGVDESREETVPAPEPVPAPAGGPAEDPFSGPPAPAAAPSSVPDWFLEGQEEDRPEALLKRRDIVLDCPPVSPQEAIRACGRLLVEAGYVEEPYIQGMLDREKEFPLAIGSHVAIPHAVNAARRYIRRSGMVVMTYPAGILWDGDMVKLVIGIAAQAEEHLDILGRIVSVVPTEEDTDRLVATADADAIYRCLNALD